MTTKTKSLVATAFSALALGLAATAVEAAPIGITGATRTNVGDAGQIEQITYGWHRHCYWRNGYRYCHWGNRHWRGHHYGGYRHWGHHNWWGPSHSWHNRSMYSMY